MALKHFIPSIPATKAKEFEIWRDTNMIGVGGADPFGLSVPLLRAGLEADVITQRIDTFPLERFRNFVEEEDAQLARFAIRDSYERAKRLGLRVDFRRPTLDDVREALRDGRLPIALVGMNEVHGYDIPHWVVVSGMEDGRVWVNDPYPPKGKKALALTTEQLDAMMEDIPAVVKGSRSLVVAGPRSWEEVRLSHSGLEFAQVRRYEYVIYVHLDFESPPVTFDIEVKAYAEGGDARFAAAVTVRPGSKIPWDEETPILGTGGTERDAIQECLGKLHWELTQRRAALRSEKGIAGTEHGQSSVR
jgi:hypothetical protein